MQAVHRRSSRQRLCTRAQHLDHVGSIMDHPCHVFLSIFISSAAVSLSPFLLCPL